MFTLKYPPEYHFLSIAVLLSPGGGTTFVPDEVLVCAGGGTTFGRYRNWFVPMKVLLSAVLSGRQTGI